MAWQVAFLVIASDPLRYHPLMPVAMLEKATFVLAAFWLLAQGRLPGLILAFALLDLTYGLCFVAAYVATRRQEKDAKGAINPGNGDDRSHIVYEK